jgi:hypothetical protein
MARIRKIINDRGIVGVKRLFIIVHDEKTSPETVSSVFSWQGRGKNFDYRI